MLQMQKQLILVGSKTQIKFKQPKEKDEGLPRGNQRAEGKANVRREEDVQIGIIHWFGLAGSSCSCGKYQISTEKMITGKFYSKKQQRRRWAGQQTTTPRPEFILTSMFVSEIQLNFQILAAAAIMWVTDLSKACLEKGLELDDIFIMLDYLVENLTSKCVRGFSNMSGERYLGQMLGF